MDEAKGGYRNQIKTIKMMCDSDIQKDSDCQERIEEFREKQSRLLEEAEQKLAQEKNRIGMEKVRENFSPRLAWLKSQQDKLGKQIVAQQSDFNRMNESENMKNISIYWCVVNLPSMKENWISGKRNARRNSARPSSRR